jgi:F-type H+-transporting ATPase subunit epsilon
MAERTFTVDIVTPERVVLRDTARSLQAPGVEGSFGILAGHAPMMSELGVGELYYRKESGQEVRMAISGGFLQVFSNQVTVLADTAERSEEIDLERARRALNEAREGQAIGSDSARRIEADAAAERARNRIRVATG